jgi:uncharacterized membrane protein (DUF485 family)
MKNIKYLLIGFYLVSSTGFLTTTSLLLITGYEKHWLTGEIDSTGALIYFCVAIVPFILTIISLTTLFKVMNFKRDQEIAQLG